MCRACGGISPAGPSQDHILSNRALPTTLKRPPPFFCPFPNGNPGPILHPPSTAPKISLGPHQRPCTHTLSPRLPLPLCPGSPDLALRPLTRLLNDGPPCCPQPILLAGRMSFLKHISDHAASLLKTLSFSISIKFNPTTKPGIIRLSLPVCLPQKYPQRILLKGSLRHSNLCIPQTWHQAPSPSACARTSLPPQMLTSFSANHAQGPVQMSPPLGSPAGRPLAAQDQFSMHNPITALFQADDISIHFLFPRLCGEFFKTNILKGKRKQW